MRTLLTLPLISLLALLNPPRQPARPPANTPGPATAPAQLTTIQTAHYIMQSDVAPDFAREARLRLDATYEEYTTRTAGFSKPSGAKLPFLLFKNQDEYIAAGGMDRTAGVFIVDQEGPRLMAIADPGQVWHVTQHEGFHQFAYFSISQHLPLWCNEGLAEYFGESLFTGDAMISGLVPDGRRARVVKMIADNKYHPFSEFITISDDLWQREMNVQNYDQAWSMVHFMAEAENGKYQKAFLAYMRALAQGQDSWKSWTAIVGTDQTAFEAAWKKYWTTLPSNPTYAKYQAARLSIYASFLARAKLAGQKFTTLDEFLTAAKSDQLKLPNDKNWLPTPLLKSALLEKTDPAAVSLTWTNGLPQLSRNDPDGTRVTIKYQNQGGKPRTTFEITGGK